MNDNLEGKSAPWPQIEACLTVLDKFNSNIKALINLKNDEMLTVKDLETKAIKPLYLIY